MKSEAEIKNRIRRYKHLLLLETDLKILVDSSRIEELQWVLGGEK
jgi:hypothetical protein